MQPKMIIFGLIKSLHDLFTALWVGGLLTSALSFMPTLKELGKGPQVKDIMIKYQKHLRVVALISILGLWVTGIFLGRQSEAYTGFMQFSSTYNVLVSIKHLIVFVMIVIVIVRGYILGRKIAEFTPSQQKLYAALLMINTVLGVVVLFLSGLSATIG
jgi:putative copper export protein